MKASLSLPARQSFASLKDIKKAKQVLDTQARLVKERETAQRLEAAQAKAQRNLFLHAVGLVNPMPVRHQPGQMALLPQIPPLPIAAQQKKDEQAVMRESLSDGFDVESLLDTDEALSFRRPGLGQDVLRKLRRGGWSIQGQLDLHGLRREEAREALGEFIRIAKKSGWRCVRIVHGKGLGSPGKAPVLKGRVQSWLVQKQEVIAFVQARPAAGGAGAVVVLLSNS